ncbi:hypothetical protein GMJAKD_08585 [Candidatus Electrothrix aarhusensis]
MNSKSLSTLIFSAITLITSLGYANVTLDYPGWALFGEDTDYPGIPSKDIDEYKEELKEWSDTFGIELLDSSLNYISSALDIGFTEDVTINVDGTEEILFSADYPVNDQMRDVLFLESMQESIKKWKEDCIYPMGTASGASLRDAYSRAFGIFNIFKEYTKDGNPIIKVLFGSGSTSYGNLFEADGYIEEKIEENIKTLASNIVTNQNLLTGLSIKPSTSSSDLVDFFIDTLDSSNAISSDTTLLLKNLSTGGFALVEGGTSLIAAPAIILYNTADYISTQLHESAQGAHLVNMYYFSTNYPDLQNEYLNITTGGLKNFLEFQTGENSICSSLYITDDSVANALCSTEYGGFFSKDNTTEKDKKTAYMISALFSLVEGLDLRTMKKEILARVKLEELKIHSFALFNSHLTANQYKIRLPDYVLDDADHGGVPASITYTIDGDNIKNVYPDAISNEVAISGTVLIKELIFDLSAYEETKEDQVIKATIVYPDGYTVYSTTRLTFYPQIDSLELVDLPDPLFSKDMEMSVKFCGDESYYARLFYKRSDAEDWDAQFFHLSGIEDLGGNCRKFSITVDGDEMYEDTGYVSVDFKVKVEAAVSPTYTRNMVNPDDLDADLLSDAWENEYFGSLDELAGGDFDNDGETNYQEWLHQTDPTKPGIEGIIRTYYVDSYGVSGDVWAHVELRTGTLDLAGRTLTIMGNFIHSGGVLNVNGGKLIVKGDYRIGDKTAEGEDAPGSGRLLMSNDSDHILVEGDFLMNSQIRHDGGYTNAVISAGVLEIKGDFTQKYPGISTADYSNFQAAGTHKVLLSGSGPQTVTFESARNANESHFNILEITNPDPTQIGFNPGEPTTSNLIYSSGLLALRDLNIGKIGLSLPMDIKVALSEGTAFGLYGQTLNLNGHTLTVEGDFLHSSGVLNVNGGKLIVKGDYRIGDKTAEGEDAPGSGRLLMSNDSDHILVEGDFLMNSQIRHDGGYTNAVISAGVLEIKGDFTQKYPGISTADYSNFQAAGTHKVLLSGSGPQTVTFESARNANESHFNILEITNPDPTQIGFNPGEPTTSNIIYSSGLLALRDLNIGKIGLSLPMDIKVALSEGTAFGLYGQTLNLNGHTLTVEGDFLHSSGVLNVNGGKLIVKGDYRIGDKTAEGEDAPGSGRLLMSNDSDHILVEGDFLMNSQIRHDGGYTNAVISAGVLEIKGDFTQKYPGISTADYNNFQATGTHKVLLSGSGTQAVTFESARNASESHFNILEITNPDPTQINFNPGEPTTSNIIYIIRLAGPADLNIGKIGLSLPMDIKVALSEGTAFGLYGQTLNLNGHTLTVEGDFLHSSGVLNVNGGKLIVKGDYRIGDKTAEGEDAPGSGRLLMSNDSDHILVEGDFLMNSQIRHDGGYTNAVISAGVLEIKGDFTQKYPGISTADYNNFQATGTHKVLLSGSGTQAVTFESARNASESHFNILEITNPDPTQINFNPGEPTTSNIIYSSSLLSLQDLNIGKIGLSLPMDIKVALSEGTAFGLYGQTLNLNGHTLTVEGDFLHSSGVLNVNGGKLIVKGDYRIGDKTAEGEDAPGSGRLLMSNDSDHILVEGDFLMNSQIRHDGGYTNAVISAGVLEIKGDFTQKYPGISTADYNNFQATGTHKVLLSGSGTQAVTFESARNASESHFNILEITNPDPTQINFNPGEPTTSNIIYSSSLLSLQDLNIGKIGLSLPMDIKVALSEGTAFGLYGQTLNLNGHTLTVEGDFLHSSGVLNVNGGKLIVKGDYRIGDKTAEGEDAPGSGRL